MRKMIAATMLLMLGCSSHHDEDSSGAPTTYSSGSQLQPEIVDESGSWREKETYPDPCGYQVIIVNDDVGNMGFVTIPIPCDPMQDFYYGCPMFIGGE